MINRDFNWIFAEFPNPVLIWLSDAVYQKFKCSEYKPGDRLEYRKFNNQAEIPVVAVVSFADGKRLILTK